MQGMTSIGVTDRQDHGDAIDSYFECITSCEIDDGICVEQCVLVHLKQGDDGDFFYVVDAGELDCTKQYKDKDEPTFLLTYNPGMSFGELALLYNCCRKMHRVTVRGADHPRRRWPYD